MILNDPCVIKILNIYCMYIQVFVMNNLIETLQNKQLVWQGSAQQTKRDGQSTGYSDLDKQLNGGLPSSGVIEILSDVAIGELRLLLPSMIDKADRLLVFISPPGSVNAHLFLSQGVDLSKVVVIYPDDQKNALWSAEQCLKSGACDSVVMWAYEALEIHQIKRLQLASEKGASRHFIMRNQRCESLSLPVDLSLSLSPTETGLNVQINKIKYGWPSEPFALNMQNNWPKLTCKERINNIVFFPNVNAKAG